MLEARGTLSLPAAPKAAARAPPHAPPSPPPPPRTHTVCVTHTQDLDDVDTFDTTVINCLQDYTPEIKNQVGPHSSGALATRC